jgi:hypothetical protein
MTVQNYSREESLNVNSALFVTIMMVCPILLGLIIYIVYLTLRVKSITKKTDIMQVRIAELAA